MSDIQQGPDWWLASDGKWYPPESRPAQLVPPAPPAPQTPQFNIAYAPPGPGLSSALTGWLVGLFLLSASSAAAASVANFVALNDFNSFMNIGSRQRSDDWLDMDDVARHVTTIFIWVWIVTFVVLVLWMHRAHKATQRLWTGQRRWGAGWTIGGWFIPVAQLVIPKLVLNEIERIAKARRSTEEPSGPIASTSTAASGYLWWIFLSVGLIAAGVGRWIEVLQDNPTAQQIRLGYILLGAGLASVTVGLLFGITYVGSIGKRLSPKGLVKIP